MSIDLHQFPKNGRRTPVGSTEKSRAEIAMRAARARQRLLEKAEDRAEHLHNANGQLVRAIELVLEGIRIGILPDTVVCPKGGGVAEVRLASFLTMQVAAYKALEPN